MITIEPVRGNTFCFVTRFMRIPFYRLNASEIVLMDSGLAAERDALEQALEENGLRPRAVLTTHAHYDHIGNHNWLQARYGARLYVTLFDAGITQNPLTLQACFYTDRTDVLASVYPYMLLRPDHILEPGAFHVQVEGAEFEILQLPGHAHEHIGFVTPDNVAYLGDLLLSEDEFRTMRLPFHQGWQALLRSMDRVRDASWDACILAHNGVYDHIRPIADHNREQLLSYAGAVAALAGESVSQETLFARTAAHFSIDLHNMSRIHIFDRIFHSITTYLEETGQLECVYEGDRLCYRRPKDAALSKSPSCKGVHPAP